MYSILSALFENSVIVAVLFFGVWLIKKLFRSKLSAGMHYLIWGVVVLKLILPVQFSTAISPWNLLPRQTAAAHAETPEETAAATGKQAASQDGDALPADTGQKDPDWRDIISAAWITGMATMGLWFALGIRRLRRNARDACPAPEWVALIFEKCVEEVKIKRKVKLSVEKTDIPAVRGVFRPVVMLPAALAQKKDKYEMRLILLHELMHIKHADIAVTYMLNIINIVYLFNPLVWVMARLISADMEMACDASALHVFGIENRQPYIETLVRFARDKAGKIMQPSLCLSDSGINMKRRIESMFLNKKTKRPVKAAITFLVCMLAALCFTSACSPVSPEIVSPEIVSPEVVSPEVLGPEAVGPEIVGGSWDIVMSAEQVDRDNDFGIIGMGFDICYRINISLDENGDGIFHIELFHDLSNDLKAEYREGKISAQGEAPRGLTFSIEGRAVEENGLHSIQGTWRLYYDKTGENIESGVWSGKKA